MNGAVGQCRIVSVGGVDYQENLSLCPEYLEPGDMQVSDGFHFITDV